MNVSPEMIKMGIAVVFGSGLFGAVLKFRDDVNIVKVHVDELKQQNLNVRVTKVEQSVDEIKNSVAKLSILDSMSARQEMLLGEVRDMRSVVVPRAEHDARWRSFEDKLGLVRDDVRMLNEKMFRE